MEKQIRTTVEAAEICVQLAEEAAREGTFGVGALLVDSSGRVLVGRRNQVLQFGELNDPTAHAERLIVDWYHDQLSQGTTLPSPDECTIVSSLDPCIHCAGAILTTGFKAVSLASDDTAGVFARPHLRCLPERLRAQASQTFSRFQVEGHPPPEYSGRAAFDSRPLEEQTLPEELYHRARTAFLDSLKPTRLTVSGGGKSTGPLSTMELGKTDDCVAGIFDEDMLRQIDFFLNVDLRDFAAFFDPTNRIVFIAFDQKNRSPVKSAFAELTRQYARHRRLGAPLSHPKDCILLTKFSPNSDCEGLITVGAYGSTMETKLPPSDHERWIYVYPNGANNDWIGELPPLYSEVIGIAPTLVGNSTFVSINGLYAFISKHSAKAQISTKRTA